MVGLPREPACFVASRRRDSLGVRIAIIGWGSLIWCPGSLNIATRWRRDGPLLPIEFARISVDGRLTLVIHRGVDGVRTYWAVSGCETLDQARENLREREGSPLSKIHWIRSGEPIGDSASYVHTSISSWLARRNDLDATIWAGLESNWDCRRLRPFSADDAVRYMLELEEKRADASTNFDRAAEYIRKCA